MRMKEYSVDSTKVMEIAFEAIMDEIIEHVIEGICFEVHRAVKLGYFAVEEYILKEHKFELYDVNSKHYPKDEHDIFGNDSLQLYSSCPNCNQIKDAQQLMRHLWKCRSKISNNSSLDNNDKTENYENNIDVNNSDGKKENITKKATKSASNYDTMSPEEIRDFLSKRCGVVSRHSGKPCSNSSNCIKHSKEDKDEVRRFFFESLADHLVDGNIDIDTVD